VFDGTSSFTELMFLGFIVLLVSRKVTVNTEYMATGWVFSLEAGN
jgi:hypothetical protein